jgi:hypothetical protein
MLRWLDTPTDSMVIPENVYVAWEECLKIHGKLLIWLLHFFCVYFPFDKVNGRS